MDKKTKKYLDSLSDDELHALLQIRYGQYVTKWEKCSKEEYEENCPEYDGTIESVFKWLNSVGIYKREPHWKNQQCGIMWQIEHYNDEPDYYTYSKAIGQEFVLMLGSEMIDYLHNRKPCWY